MTTLERLTADDLRAVVAGYRDALAAHQDGINRLNVYPVPDGDTGTNMALTLESVVRRSSTAPTPTWPPACKAISHGSLMGARGNSGVILSQILRGLADGVRDADGGRRRRRRRGARRRRRRGLRRGDAPGRGHDPHRRPRRRPRRPSGGRRPAADAGRRARRGPCAGGRARSARTPELLPVLRRGRRGRRRRRRASCCCSTSLLHVVDGRPLPEPADESTASASARGRAAERTAAVHADGGIGRPALRGHVLPRGARRDRSRRSRTCGPASATRSWSSAATASGTATSTPTTSAPPIEAAIDVGRPRNIRVTDLLEQVEEERWVREADADAGEPRAPAEPVATAVVAVATGDGIRRIFHSLGVQRDRHRRPDDEPVDRRSCSRRSRRRRPTRS